MDRETVFQRHHVEARGQGPRTMVFAHGFGCDQRMWRFVAPRFEPLARVVLFDHAGAGRSDPRAYDPQRHGRLEGYAEDLVRLIEALDTGPVILCGHSVGAMIGLLACLQRPELFLRLQMLAPSPCYVNEPDYPGGFGRDDLLGLLDMIDRNMLGFSRAMAAAALPQPDGDPQGLALELDNSICAGDPVITRRFAELIFLGDFRDRLPALRVPSLILQCSDDSIAPAGVGRYMNRHIPGSRLVEIQAAGHCPHMSHPEATWQLLLDDLSGAGLV